jgi:hypothetical protein
MPSVVFCCSLSLGAVGAANWVVYITLLAVGLATAVPSSREALEDFTLE